MKHFVTLSENLSRRFLFCFSKCHELGQLNLSILTLSVAAVKMNVHELTFFFFAKKQTSVAALVVIDKKVSLLLERNRHKKNPNLKVVFLHLKKTFCREKNCWNKSETTKYKEPRIRLKKKYFLEDFFLK
jgi:hypothetical protein